MKDLSLAYRTEGEHVLIELKLNALRQLFNSLDPAPFYEKDIDSDAEDYIVGAARDIHMKRPLKLVIYLPQEEATADNRENIADAIHNYFTYKTKLAYRDLRMLFRRGRWSLAMGLSFLVTCVALISLLPRLGKEPPLLMNILREGLMVSGWVAMWRPFQIYFYDWWPIRRDIQVMSKLSQVAVEVHPHEPVGPR